MFNLKEKDKNYGFLIMNLTHFNLDEIKIGIKRDRLLFKKNQNNTLSLFLWNKINCILLFLMVF